MARSHSDPLLSFTNAPHTVSGPARHWESTDPAGHLPPRSGGRRGGGRSTPRVYRSAAPFSRFAPSVGRFAFVVFSGGQPPRPPAGGSPPRPPPRLPLGAGRWGGGWSIGCSS